MCKISKQIYKGLVTDIMSIFMSFFLFAFETILLLCLFLLLFSFCCFCNFKFWFTIFNFWCSSRHLGNKFGSSTLGQNWKTAFTPIVLLTVANTLNNVFHSFISKNQITVTQELVNLLEKKNVCETSVSYCVIIYSSSLILVRISKHFITTFKAKNKKWFKALANSLYATLVCS